MNSLHLGLVELSLVRLVSWVRYRKIGATGINVSKRNGAVLATRIDI